MLIACTELDHAIDFRLSCVSGNCFLKIVLGRHFVGKYFVLTNQTYPIANFHFPAFVLSFLDHGREYIHNTYFKVQIMAFEMTRNEFTVQYEESNERLCSYWMQV